MAADPTYMYFTGSVWAEMKKTTSYKVDVCIDKDLVVTEAQCECGAGQGPTAHCKHVTVVLLGIVRFRDDGIKYLQEATCTQVCIIVYFKRQRC